MSLTLWLKKIADKEMPAFRKTAAELATASNSTEAGTEVLGRLILQDPALTARMLKLSNTAFYNTTGKPINTISRAVLVLGLDTVRSLCLSLALMESFLQGKRQERVLSDLGRSLHAAMQARTLAILQKDPQPEEVFIAALLYRLGHLVFWCFAEEEGAALEAMVKSGTEDLIAEKAVLGFSLAQLSQALVDDWKLSPLLKDLYRGHKHGVSADSVLKGWEIARLAENGWATPAIRGFVAKTAEKLKVDPPHFGTGLVKVAREARVMALQFGSPVCVSQIPVPACEPEEDINLFAVYEAGGSSIAPVSSVGAVESQSSNASVDSDALLACFRDLTKLSMAGQLSPMFQVVLKGLQDGLGMERALFATIVPGTDQVQGRSALGLGEKVKAEQFKFTIRRQMADSLSRSMEQGTLVENIKDPRKRPAVVPDTLHAFVKGTQFLFAPIQMNGRVVGAYYCDNLTSGKEFETEVVEGFRHLMGQLNLLLTQAATVKSNSST
jgi:HD-like signal output (HDOD) protein